MKKKILKSTPLILLFSLLFSFNVFAAGFTQDSTGIHYQNDDGTIVTSAWVEVSNLWFLFDENGICVNPIGALAPNDADGYYQIITSYTPFVTTDTELLNQCLANGTVVQIEEQYFITPEASTVMRNTNLTASNNENTYNNEEHQQASTEYVLNTNTKKIHTPNCKFVPKIAPQNYTTSNLTIDQLTIDGYTLCGICLK